MPTLTGFEKRILAHCESHGIAIGRGKAQRLALKVRKRAELLQAEFDFEVELRILGIFSDPTARDAVRAVESAA